MPSELTHQLEFLFALSLILSFFSWGRRLLFPFQIFTTWVHECCHAMAALLLGGSSIRITIAPDGGGLTHFKIPSGRLRHGIVASAGYVGASLIGCLIFIVSVDAGRFRYAVSPHTLMISLCVCLGLTLLFWLRNGFGFISILVLTAALAGLSFSEYERYSKVVLIFLGIQTALNALFDIRILFSFGKTTGGVASDAHTLQKLFYLPYWFWAFLWMGLSLGMMYWTFRFI